MGCWVRVTREINEIPSPALLLFPFYGFVAEYPCYHDLTMRGLGCFLHCRENILWLGSAEFNSPDQFELNQADMRCYTHYRHGAVAEQ